MGNRHHRGEWIVTITRDELLWYFIGAAMVAALWAEGIWL